MQTVKLHDTPVNNRSLPYNLEAEQALLGALLINNEKLTLVADYLRPEHFIQQVHSEIYKALCTLADRGQLADPITLRDYFQNSEDLAGVGGPKYLFDLSESIVSVVSVADYGQLIYDLYLRRELMNIGEEILTDAQIHQLEVNAMQQIEGAEKRLYDLATQGANKGGFVTFTDALKEAIQMAEVAYKRDSSVVGVTTGLVDLDKWLGGLHPSDLVIIAGRPSMGKTALATNIAFNAANACLKSEKEGAPVAFFSLEMSSEQLATRLLASESGIPSDRIRRGEIKADDFPAFLEVSRKLYKVPLYIDDTPAVSVMTLRNRARRLQRQHGLGLIVIDYLQLLDSHGPSSKRSENRVQEISDITRSLKALAKELNVPVIALSQLSRAVEQREDKRPQLADLRESGSIEQDADVVMFVFREEYYEARKEPPTNTDKHREWLEKMDKIHNQAEIIIAKQRHGPVGTIKLFFEGALVKFGNLTEKYSSNP